MDKFLFKKPRLETDTTTKEDAEANLSSTIAGPSTSTGTSKSSVVNNSSPIQKATNKKRLFQKSWFSKYSWLEYNAIEDKAFCRICKEAVVRGLLTFSTKKDDAYTVVGFSNWKNAIMSFQKHESSHAHKESVLKTTASQNVATLLDEQLAKEMKNARSIMLCIFTTVKFLCRQGLPIRGHEDVSSNFWQLLNLRKEDRPELNDWLGRSSYKWLSHDIQNEIIEILGHSVLQSVAQEALKREYFGIMVDETCDISVKEQVTFCIRTVNEKFDICEDFLGFYATPNTEAKTLFEIVKDIFVRLGLPFQNLRGQCYDGASQMQGKFKGLQKLVNDLQPQALYVHCAAHSLNLAVEDSLRYLPSMRDIMNLAKDLINTIRESPKRMEIFKNIGASDKSCKTGLRPLCPTRWTMRASSITNILENYAKLTEFFEIFSESDRSDAASKCSGYLEQMVQFKTFFFLSLYSLIMSPVEEVNTQIQSPNIGALEVKTKIKFLIGILTRKRGGFEQFWKKILEEKLSFIGEPKQPRHRRGPKKFENPGASEGHTFSKPEDYFKQIYTDVCDTVLLCLKERFESSALNAVVAVEEECVSAVIHGTTDLRTAREFFCNDVDFNRLSLHLSMLHDIVKQQNVTIKTMRDVRKFMLENKSVMDLLPEISKCIKLVRTVPVTTATAERSFSSLRRLKTYLRSTMGQGRLNHVAILNTHQILLDELDLRPLVNEFINRNPLRKSTFARF